MQGTSIDLSSLKHIVDGFPHPAAVLTSAGVISYENAAFELLRHHAQPAMPPDGFWQAFGEDDLARVERIVRGEEIATQFNWRPSGDRSADHKFKINALTHDGTVNRLLCQVCPPKSDQDPRLAYLMENLDQGVWDFKPATGRFAASKAWYELRGHSTTYEIDPTNDGWLQKIHPDDRENLRAMYYDQLAGLLDRAVVQYRHAHEDGHWVWILCRASVVERSPDGTPLRIVGTDTDISEMMDSQQAFEQLERQLKLAVDASGIGIWEYSPDRGSVHWDNRMLEMYGISDGENVRSDNMWEAHLHPDDYEETVAYAEECTRLNKDFRRDFRIVRNDGEVCFIRSVARLVTGANGTSRLIGVNIDVTEDYEKAHELEAARAQLEFDALHDQLTQLGNRRALDQTVAQFFEHVGADNTYAVMQIDLDYFKAVNDTLGHAAGDFVLTHVAHLLRNIVGATGEPFRVGGDEFTVLFKVAPDTDELNALSGKLIEAISQPVVFEGQPCSVGASIGYAIGVGVPDTHSSIFINADKALYVAKCAGRFTYRAYSDTAERKLALRAQPRRNLNDA